MNLLLNLKLICYERKKIFWSTLPGILTGSAAFLTALGSLFIVLFQIGVIGNKTWPPELNPLINENHKETPNDSKEDDVGEKNKNADSEMSGSENYKATPIELNSNVDSENQGAPEGKSQIGQKESGLTKELLRLKARTCQHSMCRFK